MVMAFPCGIKLYCVLLYLKVNIPPAVPSNAVRRGITSLAAEALQQRRPLSNPSQGPMNIELIPVCHIGFGGFREMSVYITLLMKETL